MEKEIHEVFRKAVELKLLYSCQALLLFLHSKHRVGSSPAEAATAMGLSNARLGFAKKELAKEGKITEHTPYRDKRKTKMYLTESGEQAATELWAVVKKMADVSDSHYRRKATQ